MYSYTYDSNTGGILLNSSPTGFSKEPRPVYAAELDVLGFDKYWDYDKQLDRPYMWAEANNYYYRGTLVAKLKGGDIFTAPEIIIPNDEGGNPVTPEAKGIYLRTVDIETMVEVNREMLEIIEQTTVKKILEVYIKYRGRLDCFHVAFSGGKDSCVLLDLVRKALPKGSFVVVFGDTGMEFPDTYEVVKKTKKQCSEEEIPFFIAKSHLDPKDSWELFGPPSRTLRWCCSVHKSTPQTLKLREITGKDNYRGLAFVGVRAQESAARSEYDFFNDGKKIQGQFSHNSILEWTSAEVWLYLYANNLTVNNAYKKGSVRVGCICCPMGGGKSGYVEHKNYKDVVEEYYKKIKTMLNGRQVVDFNEYVKKGGWRARKNGRDLAENPNRCFEHIINGYLEIEIVHPTSEWQEWIKTINVDEKAYSVQKTKTGFVAKIQEDFIKQNPLLGKMFRQVFRKAAYCVSCKACEANCINSAIHFDGNRVHIEGCVQCQRCHSINTGCLLFHSLRHPQGDGIPMKSLNTLSNHAPKTEWLKIFFEKGNDFFSNNSLGSEQFSFFKRFLKDAGLIEKNRVTFFNDLVSSMQWDSDTSLALIFLNLVFMNPQIEWYFSNFDIGRAYSRKKAEEMLIGCNVKQAVAKSICSAFKRLTETPLGTILRFGFVNEDGELVRTKWSVSDSRVVLYSLFKFAEKCNNYKEFTLATLLNDNIERDGVSPSRIFGFSRDDMVPILLGLSAKYPEFITASFTHDLEKITLVENKSSQDVLELFRGVVKND
jgi:phosphoadenosine phosphosulfate reductase